MKMDQQLKELQSFTVEEFQENFDYLIDRVENGESFVITSEYGNAMVVPYDEVISVVSESKLDTEEFIRIHTDHEEGC
jgi:antitoxin (DNA-binding transcriptional repressor) of toxin-antitoxin stability system